MALVANIGRLTGRRRRTSMRRLLCGLKRESNVTFSFDPRHYVAPSEEPSMESFVHLRKGRTPRRLHADLDGLKDDELGRGGFTGRTANIYRRHDPTAYPVGGPAAPDRRAVQRAQTQRCHRRQRWAAADVQQRRLPDSVEPPHEPMPFLHPPRRRRPAVLRPPGRRSGRRPNSGRCATGRATGCTSRRHAPGASCPTARRRC